MQAEKLYQSELNLTNMFCLPNQNDHSPMKEMCKVLNYDDHEVEIGDRRGSESELYFA